MGPIPVDDPFRQDEGCGRGSLQREESAGGAADHTAGWPGGNPTRVCTAAGIVQSMGRTGAAVDNVACESYHSTLEFELLSRTRFATRVRARLAMIAWTEEYNTERRHSANGMITPVDYEHGWRRPGAKSYDQLRRPPIPSRCAMVAGAAQRTGPSLRPQGPGPLTRRPCGASLTPEPSRARQARPTAGRGPADAFARRNQNKIGKYKAST